MSMRLSRLELSWASRLRSAVLSDSCPNRNGTVTITGRIMVDNRTALFYREALCAVITRVYPSPLSARKSLRNKDLKFRPASRSLILQELWAKYFGQRTYADILCAGFQ